MEFALRFGPGKDNKGYYPKHRPEGKAETTYTCHDEDENESLSVPDTASSKEGQTAHGPPNDDKAPDETSERREQETGRRRGGSVRCPSAIRHGCYQN